MARRDGALETCFIGSREAGIEIVDPADIDEMPQGMGVNSDGGQRLGIGGEAFACGSFDEIGDQPFDDRRTFLPLPFKRRGRNAFGLGDGDRVQGGEEPAPELAQSHRLEGRGGARILAGMADVAERRECLLMRGEGGEGA